jgi:hypothetical protein
MEKLSHYFFLESLFTKLRQMQQASSGDNISHLQVRKLESKDLEEQHSTRKENSLLEFKNKLLTLSLLMPYIYMELLVKPEI